MNNKIKRYAIEIPKAKSDRMNKEPKILTILKWDGWGFSDRKDYSIPPQMNYVEFDISEEFVDVLKNEWIDGPVFQINVTFYNSTKTRSETVQLIPQEVPITKIGDNVVELKKENYNV